MGGSFYEKGEPRIRSSPNGQTIHLRINELATRYIPK